MDKENTNQNITPVFWDENDGKWHFTEKCLNQESQIAYVTNPRMFETPDEAMQAYLEASQKFSEMMNQMKQEMLSSTLFGLRAYTPEELASMDECLCRLMELMKKFNCETDEPVKNVSV